MMIFLISISAVIITILFEYFDSLSGYNSGINLIKNSYINVIVIDFSKFIQFYKVNPSKYDFSKIDINFKTFPSPIMYYPSTNITNSKLNYYNIIFSKYGDYKKFLKFYKNLERKTKNNISDETMIGYLNDIQRDIDSLRNQGKSYIDESLKIVNEVKDRRKNNV